MGRFCVYKYSDNQWQNIGFNGNEIEQRLQRIHTNSGYEVEKFLLKKYYPSKKLLDPNDSGYFLKEIYQNIALEDLSYLTNTYEKKAMKWYEKIFLRVDENYVFISKESLPKVIEALQKIEEEHPLSIKAQNGYPEFSSKAKGLSDLFKIIELDDEYLSIGHSTGGFWGNELPQSMDSLVEEKLAEADYYNFDPDKLMDFLSEIFNYPPEVGREICFDIDL